LYKPRTKKKEKNKDKAKEKLCDEAGLFVTESTGHRIWSGGLPSLSVLLRSESLGAGSLPSRPSANDQLRTCRRANERSWPVRDAKVNH
jgi:hypothetical protein